MTAKLKRDVILKQLLQTIIDGWGHGAVLASLESLGSPLATSKTKLSEKEPTKKDNSAVEAVLEISIPAERQRVLLQLAKRFDEGSAFPKIGDIRSFLISNRSDPRDIRNRFQAFKRMLPVLSVMSEKGLEKLISRSVHSGPADLEAISNAIRGAGEDLRGTDRIGQVPPLKEEGDTGRD